jgi:sulfide:quinone oxidoreductase
MGTPRNVLVLGGGVGGVVAANRLRKRLPRTDHVTLIDREARHLFQPSLLWLAVGRRQPDAIQRPLVGLRRRGIDVIQGEISHIDPSARSVTVSGRELGGDALVIALGADLAPGLIPGLAEAGCNLYTLEGALAIARALATFRSGRIVVLTAAPAYKCPAAPYEAVMLIEHALRQRGLRLQTELELYAAEPAPMGVAGPAVSAAVRQVVESKGIRYHPLHQVLAVDASARTLSFANGTTAPFDLLVYIPPHRAPDVVQRAGLTGESGWISVDRHSFQTQHPGVFAVGDVTTIPLAMGKPLPKAGVFAQGAAEIVAANIASEWTGHAAIRSYDGHGQCFLETGDGRAGLGAGNYYAEPLPQVRLHSPNRWWHWGKVLFERRWLSHWL